MYSRHAEGLSCPPGLAPVSFSPRAVEAINKRKKKMAHWYFDMELVQHYWNADRFYHHTAPISMLLRHSRRAADHSRRGPGNANGSGTWPTIMRSRPGSRRSA